MQDVLFWILAVVSVVSAGMVVTRKHPIYAAISLMGFFLSLSGIYFLVGATFVAVMQILIYVGAILVLFLFIIMLLDLRGGKESILGGTDFNLPVALFTLCFLVVISGAVLATTWDLPFSDRAHGTVEEIAKNMYRNHAVAIELVSILLLASMVGAVALVYRRPRFGGETGATAAVPKDELEASPPDEAPESEAAEELEAEEDRALGREART